MAKPKKLKVFRTPIGFHDAYVAAPSQKAALEAWGADSNLFAQGVAEQVTDETLMKEPLERPGEVIRRLRGSQAEHVAALDAAARPKDRPSPWASPASAKGAKKAPKAPKPSRAELEQAEAKLEKLEKRQRSELQALDEELERLERRRRELQRRHEAEHDKRAAERDRALAAYERAVRRWERGI